MHVRSCLLLLASASLASVAIGTADIDVLDADGVVAIMIAPPA